MFSLEVVPASLLAVLVMSPAIVLFLLVERLGSSRGYLKHATYFIYFAVWILLFTHAYLTAVELPELALLAMLFVTVAAISGYAPLLGAWRFSLRTMLVATTIFALMLGMAAYAATKI
jgi:hypothetical protein